MLVTVTDFVPTYIHICYIICEKHFNWFDLYTNINIKNKRYSCDYINMSIYPLDLILNCTFNYKSNIYYMAVLYVSIYTLYTHLENNENNKLVNMYKVQRKWNDMMNKFGSRIRIFDKAL